MTRALILAALLLGGCAQPIDPPNNLPRAVVWGTGQPACLMLCEISIVANDNESDFIQARGSTTSTKSPTTSVKQSQTYSPSNVSRPRSQSQQPGTVEGE
jgi:type II secretory pathway pseudopilin PulG